MIPLPLIGKVDAVSIVTPTVLHHRIAKQFLEQGIHVLVEKPMTETIEQADELIGLAARKNVLLQVGHIERFNPAVTAVKSLLKTPRYITAERAAPFTVRCTDVNVVLDLMIHDLDIVTDLAGSMPKELSAAGVSLMTNEIDMATVRIVYHNGCIADVTASRISDEKKRLLRIFDEQAIYTSDYQTQKATISRATAGDIPQLMVKDISSDRRDTLEDEIRAFVQSVRSGVRPARVRHRGQAGACPRQDHHGRHRTGDNRIRSGVVERSFFSMTIPMVDLKVQYEAIRDEINNAVLGVIQSSPLSFSAPRARRLKRRSRAITG